MDETSIETNSADPLKADSMKPVFTLARASDADELVELMREFYAFEHLAFDEGAARGALRQILGDGRFGVIHLIRMGAEAAGYLVVTFGFSLEFRGRDAFVDELYLRENFRGRGIGRASIEFAAELCRGEGIAALHLEVERANTRAQALYRRAGFRDHDRYLLTKSL
ncbi:MAG TPA: GNAT family N-acetyltransferase [Pyrinomonadaceae bacterium]|nr:GNAT family N-acetyltransferase [Pyrinomonadaceae bacterium]